MNADKSARTENEEEKRMVQTWMKVKDSLYEGGLDRFDETAKSLISLSSILITIGFSVTGTLIGYKIFTPTYLAVWLSFAGFFCFMLTTISSVFVVFRRPFLIEQLSTAPAISAEWERIRCLKYRYMKFAYAFFTLGIMSEIAAILSMIALGAMPAA